MPDDKPKEVVETVPASRPGTLSRRPLGITREDALTTGGLMFMVISLGAIYFELLSLRSLREIPYRGGYYWSEFILNFSSPLLMFVSAVIAFTFGFSLLRAAGTATKQVIPPQDADVLKPMLRENNTVGIGEYIRLSSLTGFIGAFTKLGLSGLPLATIGLTILFALLGLKSDKLYDLAKLTLGAFLGSYVQRQVSDVQKRATDVAAAAVDVQTQIADIKKQLTATPSPTATPPRTAT